MDLAGLRAAYSAFLRPGRILLSGHSHQAWPDCARTAQIAYFDDAAEFVDEKWDRVVFPRLDHVRRLILRRLGLPESDPLAFGQNTHELCFRLLSCLPGFMKASPSAPRIVTTTGEFHSLRRQLKRLEEEGWPITWIDATDRHTLSARIYDALTPDTTLLAVSAVFFEDSYVLPDLAVLLSRAVEVGAIPLVDAYHAFNIVPLVLGPAANHAFITGGGYKYAGYGEGLSFLRCPPDCSLRPVYTGWFADFSGLTQRQGACIGYGPGGSRFAGATFDGSAVYRAQAVLDLFEHHGLDVPTLRRISRRQTSRILHQVCQLGRRDLSAISPNDPDRRGGFVSLRVNRPGGAAALVQALRERGVYTDSRGDLLRLGPAPYLTDEEIDTGVECLGAACSAMQGWG